MSFLTKEWLTSPEGKEQLKALDESIVIWKEKSEGVIYGEDDHCPLCDLRNVQCGCLSNCRECIIAVDTARYSCDGTPYYEVDENKPEECKIMLGWLINLKQRANDCINS